jgi:DNA invertase Pin-like site-specific DNA recombinase/BMFP domain-containing protein YqiC
MGWLRVPLLTRTGFALRIVIYARYSTDEQNPRSSDDQVAYCRRFLEGCRITDAGITVLKDDGVSGEVVSRPGINEARNGILARRWDVVLAEDASRLFRNVSACLQMVEAAVDAGIRVVCINDRIDTAEEDEWEDRLYEALHHHVRSNHFTARRIKRALEALWELGAAIGPLRPGYRRRPTHPATERDPERGPFFDEIDERWSPVVEEAFQRIARRERPRDVAAWLTEVGLPKTSNSLDLAWTERNVISLIRMSDYRGLQSYRNTISKKQHVSGRHRPQRNEPQKVLTREMPHLRIVSDHLWYEANAAVDQRRTRDGVPRGNAHPLAGVPRNSRGPLSGIFVCGICREKMWVEGRRDGGYRCRGAKKGDCWNKATADRVLTHERIATAIVDQLRALRPDCDRLLTPVREAVARIDGPRDQRRQELERERSQRELELARLVEAIEHGVDPPRTLLERLRQRQEEYDRACAELKHLDESNVVVPASEQLARHIDDLSERLSRLVPGSWADLRSLVSEIRAVPYQQFDSNKVVLRAEFDLQLAGLLPPDTRSALTALAGGPPAQWLGAIPLCVDLFEPSTGPRLGPRAIELADAGVGLTAIGKELSTSKRGAHIAVQYGRRLREAGVGAPFIRLTEAPAAASRWRLV